MLGWPRILQGLQCFNKINFVYNKRGSIDDYIFVILLAFSFFIVIDVENLVHLILIGRCREPKKRNRNIKLLVKLFNHVDINKLYFTHQTRSLPHYKAREAVQVFRWQDVGIS